MKEHHPFRPQRHRNSFVVFYALQVRFYKHFPKSLSPQECGYALIEFDSNDRRCGVVGQDS